MAIKKIALICPHDSFLSYGLRLVSSYLRTNNISTRMIFLPSYTEIWQQYFHQESSSYYSSKIIEQIRNLVSECDAVGITMMTMDKERVKTLIVALTGLEIPILLGGVHPTVFPNDAIQLADHIVIGDGCEALLEWCREPGRRDIENIWTKDGAEIYKNPVRPAVDNIDIFSFPDYGPQDHWILYKNKIRPVTKEIIRTFMGTMYHQFATMGCPFSCTFCVNNRLKKIAKGYGKFHCHSVDYIINEIKYGLELSPDIQHINFPDDGFIALSEDIIEEFSEKYRREIGLPFSVMGIIPAYVTRRKFDLLVAAGLKRVRVGLQTANTATLRSYKRAGNSAQYDKCNDLLQSYKNLVFPYYDIIVDNPLVDNEQDMVDTIEFLVRMKGRFTIVLYSMRMYPGTDIYDQAKEQKVDEKYFEDSYFQYTNRLLNYILTVIQCTDIRFLPKLLLLLYRRTGNIKIPRFLFKFNLLLYMTRCGIEHIRKRDTSGIPRIILKILSLFIKDFSNRKTKGKLL